MVVVLVGLVCLLWFERFFVAGFNSVDILTLYGMVALNLLLVYWFSCLCCLTFVVVG